MSVVGDDRFTASGIARFSAGLDSSS